MITLRPATHPALHPHVAIPRRGDDHFDAANIRWAYETLRSLVGAMITRHRTRLHPQVAHVAIPRRGDDHARHVANWRQRKVAIPRRGDDHCDALKQTYKEKYKLRSLVGAMITQTYDWANLTGNYPLRSLVGAMITLCAGGQQWRHDVAIPRRGDDHSLTER